MNKDIFDHTLSLYKMVTTNLDDWEREKALLIQQKQILERQLNNLCPGWRTKIVIAVPQELPRVKRTTGNPNNDVICTEVLDILMNMELPKVPEWIFKQLVHRKIILNGLEPLNVLHGRLSRSNGLFVKYEDGWMIKDSPAERAYRARAQ